MKKFNIMYNIGRAKYCINFFDGITFHKDGSEFYGIKVFTNKQKFEKQLKKMLAENYLQTN